MQDKPQKPEKERQMCEFFYKIGACRHGDSCNRVHFKPEISQTLLFTRMYQNPKVRQDDGEALERDEKKISREFNEFYEDVFRELCEFGEVLEFIVCGNDNDHLMGNVYVKYDTVENAAASKKALTGRYYAGKMLHPSFCRVVDFREARCRQQDQGTCTRGGLCNFIHVIEPDRKLQRDLFNTQPARRKKAKKLQLLREQEREERRKLKESVKFDEESTTHNHDNAPPSSKREVLDNTNETNQVESIKPIDPEIRLYEERKRYRDAYSRSRSSSRSRSRGRRRSYSSRDRRYRSRSRSRDQRRTRERNRDFKY
ncbi:U2 snRNP auxiliary factor small subunit [Entamoeba marina]